MIPLIKAAIGYNGFSFLDVISPCVTFNNHPQSTKSFDYVRAHNQVMGPLDFVAEQAEITAEYAEGTSAAVTLHDGSKLMLNKLDGGHDPRDPDAAIEVIRKTAKRGEIATGLLYVNQEQVDLHDALGSADRPLNEISCAELCPGSKALEGINARLR